MERERRERKDQRQHERPQEIKPREAGQSRNFRPPRPGAQPVDERCRSVGPEEVRSGVGQEHPALRIRCAEKA